MSWLRRLLGLRVDDGTPDEEKSAGNQRAAEAGSAPSIAPDDPQPDWLNPDVVEMPIDGELDLHSFSPRDTRDVVAAYIEEAHGRGLRELRIVHGKGIGVQRQIVHSVLEKHPLVASFRLAGEGRGGWGATLVDLVP